MRRPVQLMCALMLLALSAATSVADDARATRALERMRAAAPGKVEAEWDAGRGTIRSVWGRLADPSPEAPRAIADRFLADHADLFQLAAGLADLRLAESHESPAGRHLRYEQTYQGLPVFESGVEVHVATDGEVFLARNDYAAGLDLTVSPALSSDAAAAIAREAYLREYRLAVDKRGTYRAYAGGGLVLERRIDPALGIYPADGSPRLAYRVLLYARSPFGLSEFILDASNGGILRSRSLVQDSITGRGQVFDPNPVNTLNDTTLRDNGNADSPAFAPAYRTVPLPGITRLFFDLFGAYVLAGPYAWANDLLEPPYIFSSVSGAGDFIATRDRRAFEEVMVYYHIDRAQRYIQSLGFKNVNNRQVAADPHGLGGIDNSHYVPFPPGSGFLAFGEGGVDDAEDADVILHEYGHSIQDNQTTGKYLLGSEAGAQGEGFGDYWAFTNGPITGFDPPCIAEWDFQGTCLRRVDSAKQYPRDIVGEVHADGEIWSSTLHDIFLGLGKPTADTVVLESHFLVPYFPSFCAGGQALQRADDRLYGAAHRSAIGTALAGHGIAGDLTAQGLSVPRADPTGAEMRFAIVNRGSCPVSATAQGIHLVGLTMGDQGEVARVDAPALAGGASAAFDVVLPVLPEPFLYRIVVDASGEEIETDEGNNSVDSEVVRIGPVLGEPAQ